MAATQTRFLTAGLGFFASALVAGLVLLAVAPLDAARALCGFALVCAAAGFLLHYLALRARDPSALAALRARTAQRFRRLRNRILGAVDATHDAADTVWPCAVR